MSTNPSFIAKCPAMQRLVEMLPQIAESDINVFLQGASGVGKDVIAKRIHDASPRAGQPFLSINCAALSEQLLESELFGHKRGSFTGADRDHKGLFEQANGGTLFLNEIGDAGSAVQAKMLQAAEGKLMRVGGESITTVNVRLITATHRPLLEMVDDGEFRRDLYYRLAKVTLKIPPLCERGDDILEIGWAILKALKRRYELSDEVQQILLEHDWPGNVRELENVLHRAALFADLGKVRESGDVVVIERDHIVLDVTTAPRLTIAGTVNTELGSPDLRFTVPILPALDEPRLYERTIEAAEKALLTYVLNVCKGNQSSAAKMLGITRGSLRNKATSLGIRISTKVS